MGCSKRDILPRASEASVGARASRRRSAAIHVGTSAEVRRNVGSTARGATLGGVLGVLEGQVAHLQTVGHDCGC